VSGYEAGSAYISVLPSLKGFQQKIDAELRGIQAELLVPVKPELDPAAKQKTKREGEQAGGEFADAFTARVKTALKALPKAEITAESSDADRKIQEIRAQLEELSSKRVGVDISDTDALAKIAGLQAELNAVGSEDSRVSVRVDTAVASAALDDLKTKIDRTLNPNTAPEGARAAGAWADSFKARLGAALTALPDVKIGADPTTAVAAIAGVRERLEALSNKQINIDVDEKSALAEVAALETILADVAREHPSVEVRVDAAEAIAKLAAIRTEVEALDHSEATPEVKVDDGGSTDGLISKIGGLRLALVALAPMAVPIAASLVPAIAGIGVAAIAAVAGLAVLKLGLSGISEAYSAMDDADTSASQNAGKNAQAISDAEQSVADARQSAADSAVSAAERVQQAQQSLADAERTSVEQVNQALERQKQAEQSLADAQRQALRTQQDLNNARQSAARNLQDLQLAAVQADIDQRSATLQLAQAQQALISVRSNPFAAPGQLAAAQLQLESAQLSAQRTAVQQQRSGEDLATAQQQGVEGAPGVVSAGDALTRAQEGVGSAQQQVGDAGRAVADAQIEAAEKVANAEQAVTDAFRQQAIQARQSGEAIVKAQEALYNAENSNADAVSKVNTAMAALSPAGQQFVLFLRSIKPELDSIGLAAQQALLPGIQAGIQALLPTLPAIRGVVAQIAGTIGALAKSIGEALASPFWQGFLKTIGAEISPALTLMVQILGQLAEGGARVFLALLPLANQFGQAVESMSAQFLAWAKSPALGQFVDYVQRSVAVAWPLFASIGNAVLALLPPIAELGLAMLKVAAPIVESLLPPLVTLTQIVGGALAQCFLALAGPVSDIAQIVGTALSQAFVACEPVITAIVGAFKSLVDNGVVPLVRDGLRPLITQALPPILSLIPVLSPIIQAVGDTFAAILPPIMQVVSTLVSALIPVVQALVPIIKPILEIIGDVVTAVLGGIVVPMFQYILIPALQLVANVLLWLVNTVVVPGMRLLGEGIQFAYDNWIHPCFNALMDAVRNVASTFSDAVGFIGTAWDGLKKVVGTPVKFVIDYVYNAGIVWLWNHVADLIGLGHLDPIDTSSIPHFAGGGILAGYAPGSDVVPALLSPGEAVLVPEAVQMLGPATILGLNASASGRAPASGTGIARFADGGIVGDILGFVSGAAGDVVKFLTDPIGSIKAALGNTQWVDMLAHLPATLLDKAGAWIWDKLTSIGNWFGGGGGGTAAGSPQLDAWIAQAMGIAGVPATWALGLHTLIMRESGGNPKAINLTDSNAQRGDPSRGLMQTIMSTFEAYRDPSLPNDIFDPVANIVAGIRYIERAYGSIANVQQANPNLPPKGYDAGGILPPGLSTVLNGTGQPEAILTSAQFAALAAAPSFPFDGWEITGALTVDGMDARIDGRINRAEQRAGTAIAQRSRL
jgi:SLT domain-containing protein/phage-related protein